MKRATLLVTWLVLAVFALAGLRSTLGAQPRRVRQHGFASVHVFAIHRLAARIGGNPVLNSGRNLVMNLVHSRTAKPVAASPGIKRLLETISESQLRGWFERISVPRHFGADPEQNRATTAWLDDEYVTIADWNNFEEETAIEDSYAWKDGREFTVSNLYTWITRACSRLWSGAKVKGDYYRSESDPRVYQFDGAKLVCEVAMPRRAVVILAPDDAFEALRPQLLSH